RRRRAGTGRRPWHHRGDRPAGNRAFHHGRRVRRGNPVGDDAGDLVQVHQAQVRTRAAHIPHGAAAPSFRGRRLEGNPGRRALLDHQHDAGADRPFHFEVAMNSSTEPLRTDAPRVLILGLGETGVAAARWCARQGAALRVADTRDAPGGLAALREALADAQVEYCLGCGDVFDPALLDGVAQLVLSPGLAPAQSPARELLGEAAARGIEVVGEIELFARALAELAESREYRPKVLAVTGTNGKTTGTALTRKLVEAGGLSARAAGNIGPAALAALLEALDTDALPQVWVLELSSFQIETTRSLMADAAVVLNVTQDHLDWHGGMDAYASAKARLLQMARVAIVNRDDSRVAAMVEALEGMQVRSFGREAPVLVGDMGLESGQGMAWLAASEPNDF